jgi:hypothetical protein
LYFSPSIIRTFKLRSTRWAGNVARVEEKRDSCRVLVGKHDGKISLGTRRHRWSDNIKMNLKVVGWDNVDLVRLGQDRNQRKAVVCAVTKRRVP